MKILKLLAESNIFEGVTLKKGLNVITDKTYKLLIQNKQFNDFLNKKVIKDITPVQKAVEVVKKVTNKVTDITDDIENMSYKDLCSLAKSKNIKANGVKKDELIKLLKGE